MVLNLSWGPPATTYFVCLSHRPHPIQVLQILLMSWWVESGVLNEGDIQNMLWLGVPRTSLRTTAVHYCCSSMPRLSETRWFLQSSSFCEARCALIGQLSSALWLAEYLKRETEMLRPLPYCDAVSRCDKTKTIKPIINETFVASSGDIIADYNDLYCLFMRRVASRRVNITMSAFVIGETTNKCYSTLLKTRVWIVSGKFFK